MGNEGIEAQQEIRVSMEQSHHSRFDTWEIHASQKMVERRERVREREREREREERERREREKREDK